MRALSLTLLLLLLGSPLLRAQERQTYLDSEQTLLVISQKLEKKINLFPEYENFSQARLFQLEGEGYVLEITLEEGKIEARNRILMDEAEMMAFQEKLSEKLGHYAPEASLDQSGRTELLLYSSAVGLGFYGWALPELADVNSDRGYIGLYMLTSGAAITTPFLLTRDKEITQGEANLYAYGATRGGLHGLLLAQMMAGPETSYRKTNNRAMGYGMLLSVGEGIAGYHLAKHNQWDRGTTATIGTYGDAGAGAATLFGLTVGPEDADERLLYATSLAGNAGGLLLGSKIAKTQSYSSGDAIVLKTSGVVGALIPVMFMAASEVDDYRAYSGGALAGGLVGLTAGHFLTQKVDYSAGQGIMIALGTVAGAGLGAGTGYLLTDNEDATLVMGALGAAGGFLTTQNLMSKRADIARNPGVSFNLQLAPEGLANLSGKTIPQVGAANPFGLSQPTPPIVRASLTF